MLLMLLKKGNEIVCSKYKFWLWSGGTIKWSNICTKSLPDPSKKETCHMPQPTAIPCKFFIKTKPPKSRTILRHMISKIEADHFKD